MSMKALIKVNAKYHLSKNENNHCSQAKKRSPIIKKSQPDCTGGSHNWFKIHQIHDFPVVIDIVTFICNNKKLTKIPVNVKRDIEL